MAAALLPGFLEQLQARDAAAAKRRTTVTTSPTTPVRCQAWEAAVAEGGAAISELSLSLARLQPPDGQRELPGVLTKLKELVSFSARCSAKLGGL